MNFLLKILYIAKMYLKKIFEILHLIVVGELRRVRMMEHHGKNKNKYNERRTLHYYEHRDKP